MVESWRVGEGLSFLNRSPPLPHHMLPQIGRERVPVCISVLVCVCVHMCPCVSRCSHVYLCI